ITNRLEVPVHGQGRGAAPVFGRGAGVAGDRVMDNLRSLTRPDPARMPGAGDLRAVNPGVANLAGAAAVDSAVATDDLRTEHREIVGTDTGGQTGAVGRGVDLGIDQGEGEAGAVRRGNGPVHLAPANLYPGCPDHQVAVGDLRVDHRIRCGDHTRAGVRGQRGAGGNTGVRGVRKTARHTLDPRLTAVPAARPCTRPRPTSCRRASRWPATRSPRPRPWPPRRAQGQIVTWTHLAPSLLSDIAALLAARYLAPEGTFLIWWPYAPGEEWPISFVVIRVYRLQAADSMTLVNTVMPRRNLSWPAKKMVRSAYKADRN